MDFTNRAPQSPATPPSNPQFNKPASDNRSSTPPANRNAAPSGRGWWTSLTGILIAAVLILLVALVAAVGFGTPRLESNYVAKSKLQAVFLTNGQVYFGNVKAISPDYIDLQNVYYLQPASTTASTTSNTTSTLNIVRLGDCEPHKPYGEMLINRDQVTFWENLQDSAQVVKLAKQIQSSTTPPNCTQPSSSGVQSGSTPTSNGSSSSSTGTSSTTNSANSNASSSTTKKP